MRRRIWIDSLIVIVAMTHHHLRTVIVQVVSRMISTVDIPTAVVVISLTRSIPMSRVDTRMVMGIQNIVKDPGRTRKVMVVVNYCIDRSHRMIAHTLIITLLHTNHTHARYRDHTQKQ